MKKVKSFISALMFSAPVMVFAQGSTNSNSTYITDLITKLKTILNSIIPLLIVVAFVVFFWELVMFIRYKKDGKPEEAKASRMGLVWALVAIFVMFSFMGIVRIMQTITGTTGGNVINTNDVPQLTI